MLNFPDDFPFGSPDLPPTTFDHFAAMLTLLFLLVSLAVWIPLRPCIVVALFKIALPFRRERLEGNDD